MRTRVLLASRVGDCGALWRACWLQNPRLTTEATLSGSLDREIGERGGVRSLDREIGERLWARAGYRTPV